MTNECHDNCGCNVAACCLQCPLPTCRYDDPVGYIHWQRQQRVARARTLAAQGLHPREVARQMGHVERTVYRYLTALEVGQ